MLSPVSSCRCICNFIPNGETSLITCSLSAGRRGIPTKGPHLSPERLRGTAEFPGFQSPALPELPELPWETEGLLDAQSPWPRGGIGCGEALGHFPVAKANLAMAFGFSRPPCPCLAPLRGSLGTPRPLQVTVIPGVSPAVAPFGVLQGP